ncbi:MAG: tail fiber domain-containing protein [Acidobacteriia bacterium]|nr:tail fiber domain-containing protein [Terriglobia bacterium]
MRRVLQGMEFVLVCLFCAVGVRAQQSAATSDLASNAAAAQSSVPRLVRFNGTLKDATGKPLSGPVDVTFELFREQSGGEPVWWETQTVEADAQGQYSALLGATQPNGLPMDLFTAGEARWLGVAAGKIEQPRVLLVSVPYAFKAGDAETLGGKPATAYVASDQLKDQVRSEMTQQLANPAIGLRSLEMMVTNPASTPRAVTETNPSTFTCATSSTCMGVTQSGTGTPLLASSTAASAVVAALRGEAASTGGSGVLGWAKATTGTAVGVKGQTDSTGGMGIYGLATAATGTTFGVRGDTSSPSGRGVYGNATAGTGVTYGVLGIAASTSGIGLAGQATAVTGATIGVRAVNSSPAGTAAIFDNLGGGKILSGRTTGYVERFSVDAGGTVTGTQFASTVASGTPPLAVASNTVVPNLNADLLDGLHAANFALLGANIFTSGQSISSGDLSVSSGNISLPQTTGLTAGVINLGAGRFIHACCASQRNTFVGGYAGNLGTTGSDNTATGDNALTSITLGDNNTASGSRALLSNTEGEGNVADGSWALSSNTTGGRNTASGLDALNANTTGTYNTASGAFALYYHTVGHFNTAIGHAALMYNCKDVPVGCSGSSNTAVGVAAGSTSNSANANVTGYNNTFIGSNSGPGTSTQLHNATAIGANAVVSANNTIVLGSISGVNNAAASVNVGIGTQTPTHTLEVLGTASFSDAVTATSFAGDGSAITGVNAVTAATASNALALGGVAASGYLQKTGGTMTGTLNLPADGLAAGTTQLALGYGNVAIGTDPLLDVQLAVRRTGTENATNYGLHVRNNTTSTSGTPYKYGAYIENSGEVVSNGYGLYVTNQSTNTTTDGLYKYGVYLSSFGSFTGGAGTTTKNYGLYVSAPTGADENYGAYIGGNVGIGDTTPATRLQVFGDIRVGTTGTNGCLQNFAGSSIAGTCSSDARLKTNIRPFQRVLNQLVQLKPVHFYWKADEFPEMHFGRERSYGLIAQEVEKLFPEMVGQDERGYKTVDYTRLPLLLLQAVRELKAENERLRDQMQSELRSQATELDSLKGELKEARVALRLIQSQLPAAGSAFTAHALLNSSEPSSASGPSTGR